MNDTNQDRPHPWEGARYARIPWVVMNDPELSDGDRTTLCQIARYIDVCGDASAHPSRATLALWANVTTKTISERIEHLVSRGLIAVVERPGSTHSYRLLPLTNVYSEDEIAQANRLPSIASAQVATGRKDPTRTGTRPQWTDARRRKAKTEPQRQPKTLNTNVEGSEPDPQHQCCPTLNVDVETTLNMGVAPPSTPVLPDVIIFKKHPDEPEETRAAAAPKTSHADCTGGSVRSVRMRGEHPELPGKIIRKPSMTEERGGSHLVVLENTNPRDGEQEKSHPPTPLHGDVWLEAKRQPPPVAPRARRHARTVQLGDSVSSRPASPVSAIENSPSTPATIENLEPALALWVKDTLAEDLHGSGNLPPPGSRAERTRSRTLQVVATNLWNIWEPLLRATGFPPPVRPTKAGIKELAVLVGSYDPAVTAKMVLALVSTWNKGLREQLADADNHPHKPIRNWQAPDLIQLAALSERRRPDVMTVLQAVAEGKPVVQQPRILTAAERAHADTLRGETTVAPEEMLGPTPGVTKPRIRKTRLG